MNYQEWEREVPGELTGDRLWKVEAYRLGRFVADVGWHDFHLKPGLREHRSSLVTHHV